VNSTQFNNQQEAQNQAQRTGLLTDYQQMLANPGYDAATKSAITNDTQGATAASFGSAADSLERRSARTGNPAGLIEGEDQLARDKAQQMSTDAAKNQITFANAARGDRDTALKGLSGVYGMDQQLLARSLGIPVEYLSQYNAARQNKPGFLSTLGNTLAGGLGAGIAGGIGTAASTVGSGNYGW
jgi:hypothetical protein